MRACLRRDVQRAANVWDRFYRRHESPWRGERPVEELLPWLAGGRVLELGCGNGKTLKPLRKAGLDVVGLDISWHILRRYPDRSNLVLGDAATLPFRDGVFGAVLDAHCIGHLPAVGRQVAVRECFRVLRPGGHLVAERLTPTDLRASQGEEVPGEAGMRQVQDGRATHFADADGLVQEYSAAGFVAAGVVVERHHPGHRGRLVTRESVRALFEKPL